MSSMQINLILIIRKMDFYGVSKDFTRVFSLIWFFLWVVLLHESVECMNMLEDYLLAELRS